MPQAILLEDHENLGAKGTVVDVSKGYLRNYLIPRKLAEPATKGSIAAAERRREAANRAVADDPGQRLQHVVRRRREGNGLDQDQPVVERYRSSQEALARRHRPSPVPRAESER